MRSSRTSASLIRVNGRQSPASAMVKNKLSDCASDLTCAQNGMQDLLEEPSREPKNLKPLINCIKTFPVSTAKCERNFSLMNYLRSDKRAVLLISTISNLMMININGPPTSKYDPRKYTTTWLKSHRAASSLSSRQCSVKTPAESKSV